MRSLRCCSLLFLLATTITAADDAAADDAADNKVLVRVGGTPITESDLALEYATAGVPESLQPKVRRRYLEGLVEARLLEQFLKSRKVEASPTALEERVTGIRTLLGRGERNPDDVLAELGLDDAALRRKLATPVAWEEYSQTVVRPAGVQEYWKKHRQRFDGTRVKARQILIKVPADVSDDDPSVTDAIAKLAALRKELQELKRDFGAAAREMSEAPSAKQGGDVGLFPYRGRMPLSFTKHVFGKEVGEITEPFRSPFGVHLVQVTEVVPGEYSLEDVRSLVFDALADEVRGKLIEKQREETEVEWLDEATG